MKKSDYDFVKLALGEDLLKELKVEEDRHIDKPVNTPQNPPEIKPPEATSEDIYRILGAKI